LINTYIFLTARIKHLLAFPSDQPLPIRHSVQEEGSWRLGSTNGKGKGKEKEPIWEGFIFEVPGFHDEIFWDWKDVITSSEMHILKRLGFQMQVCLLVFSCLLLLTRLSGWERYIAGVQRS